MSTVKKEPFDIVVCGGRITEISRTGFADVIQHFNANYDGPIHTEVDPVVLAAHRNAPALTPSKRVTVPEVVAVLWLVAVCVLASMWLGGHL